MCNVNRGDVFFGIVESRKSVRKFRSEKIERKELERIVSAAMLSPNAGNRQAWRFLVIDCREKLDAIKDECLRLSRVSLERANKDVEAGMKGVQEYYNGLFNASALIAVYTDSYEKYSHYNHHDGAIAASYICLAASALGYGSVYMTESVCDTEIRRVIDVPTTYQFAAAIPIGIPDGDTNAPDRKNKDDLLFFNTFS